MQWTESDLPMLDAIPGIVSWICDGDTLDVHVGSSPIRVRLAGLDAPEMHLPLVPREKGALESLWALARLCLGMHVWAVPTTMQPTHDQYGRLVAHIVRTFDGLHVGLEMVRQGWAFHWPRYPHELSTQFAAASQFASAMNLGLWSKPGQTALTPLSSSEPAHVD
jgi:endonuclease YncB( thermonuclease family)